MKNILQLISLGLIAATLSSCEVGGAGYVGARPSHGYHHNGNYNSGYNNNRYYGHNHPTYHRSYPRSSGVNTRVNAHVAPLNVNSSTGLRLF